MKKILSLVLAAALTLGLCLVPAGAAGTFPDVADPALQEQVEVLRLLGVVNGKPGGSFDPAGTFTRAEFCKMALTILDRQEEAQLQAGRVIFSDVTASHWALGYINAAAAVKEGSTPLVQGKGDSRFGPDDPITCGAAAAILVRCLGYSDKDVASGGVWYSGYMVRARSLGLLDGLDAGLTGDHTLTRAQAAGLFYNLLFAKPKDSKDVFLVTQLGGQLSDDHLVLELGKALPNGGYTVKTDKETRRTFRGDLSAALQGQRCQLVLDKEGDVLALRRDEDYTTRAVRILSAEARYVVAQGNQQVLVDPKTPVWQASSQSESPYSDVYAAHIPYGANAIFCYDKTDHLVSIYLTAGGSGALTAVAGSGSDPFQGLLPAGASAIYKNGVAATLSDVKPYDVGVYDSYSGVLNVCDRKLTGVYEDASPSPVSPSKVQVMGAWFSVLDCALADLSGFHLGDRVTLLLDDQNQVAGVVSADKVSAPGLGVAEITQGEDDSRGRPTYTAQVVLSTGVTLQGEVSSTAKAMEQAPGKLTAVTSSVAGKLSLSTPASAPVSGAWRVQEGKLGSAAVSPQAAVYDKTANGPLVKVGLDAVTASSISSERISFLHLDSAGAVDLVVLEDCTGDAYTYGLLKYTPGKGDSSDGGGLSNYANPRVTISNNKDKATYTASGNLSSFDGKFVGVAAALAPTADGDGKVDAYRTLTATDNVPRTAFGDDAVTVGALSYPLASNIDDCCYNAASESWFASLQDALAYATRLTVYFDGAPQSGGKVRLVVPRSAALRLYCREGGLPFPVFRQKLPLTAVI